MVAYVSVVTGLHPLSNEVISSVNIITGVFQRFRYSTIILEPLESFNERQRHVVPHGTAPAALIVSIKSSLCSNCNLAYASKTLATCWEFLEMAIDEENPFTMPFVIRPMAQPRRSNCMAREAMT